MSDPPESKTRLPGADERRLTIALAKGRMQAGALRLLARAGITVDQAALESRRLAVDDESGTVRFVFVKPADVPTYVLIPAFIISELKTAFQIGFLIFLPFLVIDLVVSSTLMSLGMMMLPPVFISLPFKILLFVLVDGWNLVLSSLVRSFH